jgi:hypothetical protein
MQNMPNIKVPVACLVLGWSSLASAHIELLEPQARYGIAANGNKACPCGEGSSNRTCAVPTERSDPNRNEDRVLTLTGGTEFVFRFDEYVGHSGRYRIAFDDDGADLDDFNAHPLADIPDPGGSSGNIGEGRIWEIPFTVPNTPCDNCTLQLIQVMDGNMTTPVTDPVGRGTYYQCVDIVIVPGEGTIDGEPDPNAQDPGTPSGSPEEDVVEPADDLDAMASPLTEADSGGCSVSRVGGSPHQGFASALLLAFALLAGRRRPAARASR